MPKGSHSGPEHFEKWPRAKAVSSQAFDSFWFKIGQNTFGMNFNKRTYGISGISFSSLAICDWIFFLKKIDEIAISVQFFVVWKQITKNYKRYQKTKKLIFLAISLEHSVEISGQSDEKCRRRYILCGWKIVSRDSGILRICRYYFFSPLQAK